MADRKPLGRRFFRDFDLLLGGGQAEDRAGMSHGKAMFGQEQLNFSGQASRSRRALVMEVRSLPVRWPISSCDRPSSRPQAFIGMSGFDRVEVFALDILDQRQFQQQRIGDFLDHHRDFIQTRQFGGSPAAFPGNQLKLALMTPNNQRLNDPVGPNGSREFLQPLGLKNHPRLHRIRMDRIDGQRCWAGAASRAQALQQ